MAQLFTVQKIRLTPHPPPHLLVRVESRNKSVGMTLRRKSLCNHFLVIKKKRLTTNHIIIMHTDSYFKGWLKRGGGGEKSNPFGQI